MKIYVHLICFTLILSFCSCDGKKDKAAEVNQAATVSTTLPTLPAPIREELLNRCTSIDIIFYDLPVSMSQDDKPSINKSINFALDQAVTLNPDCKSLGRVSFLGDGEQLQDADIFFGPSCTYFLFIEDGKPKYGSQMSPSGITFYNNIMQNFSAK